MPKHRAVPAAEKYAELEALGLERPVCGCHAETMKWKLGPLRAGGRWICIVDARVRDVGWRKDNPQSRAFEARRVRIFGERITMPDLDFVEFAKRIRDERKAALKEAS